jgi:hypothetical protein
LNSRTATVIPPLVFPTVPTTTPSAFSSRQRSNGTSKNRGVDVARNQRELALEREIVEQDLSEGLRDGERLGILGQRDEIRHGEPRCAIFAGDGRRDLGRLLRLRRRRLLRRLLGASRCGERRSGQREEDPLHH